MSMNSRAIAQRSIARQDNAPDDTSLLWLDTNFDPAKLKQYNGSTSEWQSVASSVVTKQDTAPDAPVDGDLWQDTSQSPAVLKQYDGTQWIGAVAASGPVEQAVVYDAARFIDFNYTKPAFSGGSYAQGYYAWTPGVEVEKFDYSFQAGGNFGTRYLYVNYADSSKNWEQTVGSGGGKTGTVNQPGFITNIELKLPGIGTGGESNAYLEMDLYVSQKDHTHRI